jgi:hypothetical protein
MRDLITPCCSVVVLAYVPIKKTKTEKTKTEKRRRRRKAKNCGKMRKKDGAIFDSLVCVLHLGFSIGSQAVSLLGPDRAWHGR